MEPFRINVWSYLFENSSKSIANRCFPKMQWLMGGQWIDQLSGGGTTGLNATQTLEEAKKTSECSPVGNYTEDSTEDSEVNSEVNSWNNGTSDCLNATEVDNRDFKKENDS